MELNMTKSISYSHSTPSGLECRFSSFTTNFIRGYSHLIPSGFCGYCCPSRLLYTYCLLRFPSSALRQAQGFCSGQTARLFTLNPFGIFLKRIYNVHSVIKMQQISIHFSGNYCKLVPKVKNIK